MNHKLDNSKLNKLISYANRLVKLVYFLLIVGIVLAVIITFRITNIFGFIKGILCVLLPIFIGFIIAWLFYPLVIKIEKKGIHRLLAILIVYVFIVSFIFLFLRIFIPVLYKQINDLISFFPNIINSINGVFENIAQKVGHSGVDISGFKTNIIEGLNSYSTSFAKSMPSYLLNLTKSFLSTLGIILMGMVVGIYLLIDYENMYDKCLCLLPKKYCREIKKLFSVIGEEVRKTVNGTFLVALMVFIFDTILFTIFKLESPLLFGLLCGITDLIPFIGPYIGGGAATIVAFTESTSIGITILISCVIVQLLENYVLQPVIMSKATKLNPVLIIIVLLLFGHFFGIFGMIFATPCLAIGKVVYDYISEKTNQKSSIVKMS